jgi:hypothetical protein
VRYGIGRARRGEDTAALPIAVRTGDIAAWTGDIAAWTGDIAARTGDIAARTGDIAAPTLDITLRAVTGGRIYQLVAPF